MSNTDSNQPIKSDDEWKERVRAEAVRAGSPSASTDEPAGSGATSPPPKSRPQIEARQLPPANLSTLVSMLGTQAMVALGVLPDPSTGEADLQPALAKHFIDLLGMLEVKTKEHLTIDEQRMLNSTLHELRMAFVHVSATR
jgi:hypothetical protein